MSGTPRKRRRQTDYGSSFSSSDCGDCENNARVEEGHANHNEETSSDVSYERCSSIPVDDCDESAHDSTVEIVHQSVDEDDIDLLTSELSENPMEVSGCLQDLEKDVVAKLPVIVPGNVESSCDVTESTDESSTLSFEQNVTKEIIDESSLGQPFPVQQEELLIHVSMEDCDLSQNSYENVFQLVDPITSDFTPYFDRNYSEISQISQDSQMGNLNLYVNELLGNNSNHASSDSNGGKDTVPHKIDQYDSCDSDDDRDLLKNKAEQIASFHNGGNHDNQTPITAEHAGLLFCTEQDIQDLACINYSTPIKQDQPPFSHGTKFPSPIINSEEYDHCSTDSSFNRDSDSESIEETESNSGAADDKLNELILNLFSENHVNAPSALSRAYVLNETKIHEDSSMSVNEGIVNIMNLYVQNQMTKSGLNRAIKTICKFLPKDHNLPSSSHLILSYLESLSPPAPANIHFYCETCLLYHGTEIVGQCVVCKCKTNFKYFFNFDVDAIIKYYFESRDLSTLIESKEANMDHSVLTDVTDGSVYKSLNKYRAKYDLNLKIFSDGVRIRKTSSSELWLVMGTVLELPLHLQRSFISLFGIWYGSQKPDMKTFLKPFSEKMRLLAHVGVEWKHPSSGIMHKSCVSLPLIVSDAPARAMIQNVLHFNGRFGCNICEIKTKLCAPLPNMRRIRVYMYEDCPKLRTKERMLKQASNVVLHEHVKGVKGPSVLSIIPSVDIAKCMVPEYMHSVLLGVVKQLLVIWTTKQGSWSIKCKISEIDIFLKAYRHPDFIHRRERQLRCLKYWKASDFYYFLLFESLPSLQGHLPNLNLQHLMLLVKGIFLFLKSSISIEEIEEGDLLLKLFVNSFQDIYGDRELTYNVHQLSHLGLCVRRYGPLFCWDAFPFEDLNGLIAKKTHGTNFVDKEIVRNVKICQGLQILQSIVSYPTLTQNCFLERGKVYGKEMLTRLTQEEKDLLGGQSSYRIYSKAKLGYDVFTSEVHKRLKTANFYAMWMDNECVKYGSIKFYAKNEEDIFVCLRLFHVDHTKVFYNVETLKSIEHIIPVTSSNDFVFMRAAQIIPSIVKIGKIGDLVYKRPNLYHFLL